MRKKPEQIEMEFQDSGESALVKSTLLSSLQNSEWEIAVRKEVKKFLEKARDDVSAKEVFDAVKDMARREIPQEAKKKLYDQVLEFVTTTNKK